MTNRTFDYAPAVRERVPLLIGLVGPSGSGKTFSALRLATGIQRVVGGDIAMIDTESKRALHYAETFKFNHLPLVAPFSPADYLAAIEFCKNKGASTIIVDSTSHEHEGPGGVLEWHDAEVERLRKAWNVSAEKANVPAWAAPKAARRKLINTVLQLDINLILCFRAKEKIALKGGKVIDMGWMPIAGEEWIYECALQCLLLPGCGGEPTWDPERPGERAMTKLPEQFRALFEASRPLDEAIGTALAKWAAGTGAPRKAEKASGPAPSDEEHARVLDLIAAAEDEPALKSLADEHSPRPWSDSQRKQIRASIKVRQGELA